MSVLGGGGRYKSRAQRAEWEAENIANQQAEDEFKQGLLSQLRQARIARSQMLSASSFSEGISNTGIQSGLSNIASETASATGQAYLAKERSDNYQDYINEAQRAYKDLAKHQKKKSTAIAVSAGAALAVTGGLAGAALAGAAGTSTAVGATMGAAAGMSAGMKAGAAASQKNWGGTFAALAQGASSFASMGTYGPGTTGYENMAGQSLAYNPATTVPASKPLYMGS